MKQLINDKWSFAKLPCGSTAEDAAHAVFEPVDLPHDWLIWQENLYESADAWYRREIELEADGNNSVMLRFDGVYMDCDVLLNDEVICTHPYGYTAFDVPLDGKIRNGRNTVMVHIRHRSPNSRWYSGSGIYRDVVLVTLPHEHLVPDSLYIAEEFCGKSWTVTVSAETSGKQNQPFLCTIKDSEGNITAREEGECANGKCRAVLKVSEGRTWSPEDPYLYTLSVSYGEQTEVRRIGLRSVFVDAGHGLILNGNRIRLRGVCFHHDLGALGAAFHEKAARRQLSLMKRMGANAVRTSHNPPASAFLDLCDEMGFLVVDEAFDMWERPKTDYDYARFFREWAEKDVASWIRRDRCHPSVIMWSIGNEIYDMHAGPRGAELTEKLAGLVRAHDPKRHAYTTFGCNYMPWEGGQRCAEYVDVVGYNYGENCYDAHHLSHPGWILYGSETGSVLSSRGIYHFPMEQSIMSEADQQCSALGNSNTSWGAEDLKRMIIDDLNHPFSLGQFIWSGIDYLGEPTPYHTRSCYFGQADTACFPKDSYYLFKSFWAADKMIHIGVSWDWNRGQMIDVPVMTNCPRAELFLNGVSLGIKTPRLSDPATSLPVWHIPFESGELLARGLDEYGQALCEDVQYTPGETDHLELVPEDPFLLSDGWDMTFVRVNALDAANHPVRNARDRVRIRVSGGGRLLGTDNGDSTDTDLFKSDSRFLFSGALLLIIASNGIKADTTVRITGNTFPDAVLTIPYRYAELRAGVSCTALVASSSPQRNIIPARKIDILALGSTRLSPDHPACDFRFSVLPPEADKPEIIWQVTNTAGIETPCAAVSARDQVVTVRARGDGTFLLRALCGNSPGKTDFISHMELYASGFGEPALDPYGYIRAGLYDLSEGCIGTGNDKGIAFSREGESMVGFSRVDLGKTGSDRIHIDLFALNNERYEITLLAGVTPSDLKTISVLAYQKPSVWNVYQGETWQLPQRLSGVMTICFRTDRKIHMRGFSFSRQFSGYLRHDASTADLIYGDSYIREGTRVTGIRNNVTLVWYGIEFAGDGKALLTIEGRTPLEVQSIAIHMQNSFHEEKTVMIEFLRSEGLRQRFCIPVVKSPCSVSFVFLPGSHFDFYSFWFSRENCSAPEGTNLDRSSEIQ